MARSRLASKPMQASALDQSVEDSCGLSGSFGSFDGIASRGSRPEPAALRAARRDDHDHGLAKISAALGFVRSFGHLRRVRAGTDSRGVVGSDRRGNEWLTMAA
jgi:hypothetical protein